jgi:hypothetical protein
MHLKSALLVLVASAVVASLPTAQAADCSPQVLADVALSVQPNGAVLLPARVNGHDVFFHLTLGSGLPYIRRSAIAPLGLSILRRRGGPELTSGGRPITHYAKLEDTSVGELRLVDRGALIAEDDSLPEFEGKPVVGVMGATLIGVLDAELNLSEGRFRLLKPFKCRGRSPVYWPGSVAELPMHFDEAGTLVFTIELEGKRVQSSLSLTSATSTMDVNATREFFGFDQDSPGVVKTVDGSVFHAMSLTGRQLEIRDASVRLMEGGICRLTGSTPVYGDIGYSNCVNRVPLYIGADLLKQMRIYFSREHRKMYVTLLGAAAGGAAIQVAAP